MLIFIILFNLIVAFFTAIYAKSKGHNGVLWFVLGLFFGLLALLFLAIAADRKSIIAISASPQTQIDQDSAVRLTSNAESHRKIVAELDEKWLVLKQVDQDIEDAARRVNAISPTLEKELARKFLVLNDKSYLDQIVERTISDFEAAQKTKAAAEADLLRKFDRDMVEELRRYEESLTDARLDPTYNKKVVAVDVYKGSWVGFRGGILIALEDGSKVIRRKGLTRRFLAGDDSWA